MTMTIGGWRLGITWLAWITARRWAVFCSGHPSFSARPNADSRRPAFADERSR